MIGRAILAAALVSCLLNLGFAQQPRRNRSYPPNLPEARVETYKQVGDVKLNVYVFTPEDHRPSDRRAAIVFFFGGGWRSGTPAQFHQHCKLLARHGMVAMTADYRVASRHQTKAVQCMADAKSAVRWIRSDAERLGVDPNRIVAGGGSAGGHIAACTGVVPGHDEAGEDTSVSSIPNAMVLFNPALVLAPWTDEVAFTEQRLTSLRERIGAAPQTASPIHHVRKEAPPTIIFHGKSDTTVPYKTAKLFAKQMTKLGNTCQLEGYEGEPHGFFNYGRGDNKAYLATTKAMVEFLDKLGYLDKPGT